MIQISGGKSALWWEQKRQMSGGKCDKLGGGKSDKGKWYTIGKRCTFNPEVGKGDEGNTDRSYLEQSFVTSYQE